MEIAIHPVGFELTDQGRAYVEYRMFSAIGRFGSRDARLTVRLEARGLGVGFQCVAELKLDTATPVRVRATADRLYAAIDRGAERLARALARGRSVPGRGEPSTFRRETMPRELVLVTDVDSHRLQTLIEGSKLRSGRDASSVDWLERHLDEAEVTPAARIGPDVVTMNSEIVVKDLDSGETFGFQLVFPRAADVSAGRISVLAPLGMAVLGRRVGQEISWEVPSGVRRLRVEGIVYQPERSGRDVA